ncbi:MAG: PilZ domain-containing protein [bacterium]|nr:PilZ domain-containing protein [bacterium]MDT8396133.1 PilZ domain-containing protein [bacterium]
MSQGSKSRHKRLESLNLVSLSHRDDKGQVDLEVVGRTLDLSEGGILLEIHQPLPSENRMVEVTLGIREHVIQTTGEIVHQRKLESGHIGLGIAFRKISKENAAVITDFLAGDEG